jgi:hypothetical protein
MEDSTATAVFRRRQCRHPEDAMESSLPGALLGGFVATLVMTVMMRMAGAAGITRMPPMELVTGSMITGNPASARRIGFVIHWIVMGTVVFGLGYAAVFVAVGSAAWLVGAVTGLVHGAAVGLVFMPMMPAMHPRMSAAPATAVPSAVSEVRLSAPAGAGVALGVDDPVGAARRSRRVRRRRRARLRVVRLIPT